jgi:hypothetical protein
MEEPATLAEPPCGVKFRFRGGATVAFQEMGAWYDLPRFDAISYDSLRSERRGGDGFQGV